MNVKFDIEVVSGLGRNYIIRKLGLNLLDNAVNMGACMVEVYIMCGTVQKFLVDSGEVTIKEMTKPFKKR